MYTLGGLMVSADDDMRPYCLIEDSPESLGGDEVCRGKLVKADRNGYVRKSFDILAAFKDVLGKRSNCGQDSSKRSGVRNCPATPWRSMGTSGLAGCGRRMPGTACLQASPASSARRS